VVEGKDEMMTQGRLLGRRLRAGAHLKRINNFRFLASIRELCTYAGCQNADKKQAKAEVTRRTAIKHNGSSKKKKKESNNSA
jgi:hypothetical protein